MQNLLVSGGGACLFADVTGALPTHGSAILRQPSTVLITQETELLRHPVLDIRSRDDPNLSRKTGRNDNKLMRSSKSRSRNKSNRQRTLGNIVNRVFDSSGPEGKVRGTPQQIIEKYLALARDAQLSNDRVAEQSFFQHAEHYTRMLGEAQREQAERQQHQSRDDDFQDGNGHAESGQPGHSAQGGNRQNDRQDRNERQDRNDRRDDRRDQPRDDRRDQPRDDRNRDDRRDDRNRDDRNRDDRRDDRREDRNREDRQPARAEASVPAGLPPVIASDEDAAGPVETPETAIAAPAPAPAPAAPAPVAERAPELALDEPAPAPRRRTRQPAAAAAAATPAPRAPRRRKPAEGAETKAPETADKASGE